MEDTKLDITLELEVADDVVVGVARDGDGVPTRFTGWLGLIQAIDDLLVRSSSR